MTLRGIVCDVREGEIDVVVEAGDKGFGRMTTTLKVSEPNPYYRGALVPITISVIEVVK